MTRVAVIDIGKTNAKLALVDTADMAERAVFTRPNTVLPGPPYPHFDIDGHWDFLLDGLSRLQSEHGIDAISITTHGACGAFLTADGSLAAPVLDYEHDAPDGSAAAYDDLRPPFSETGSPRLPLGLNLGAQLHWLLQRDPELVERAQVFVTYPQYWAYRLTGIAATDVSSLGCHTDLWAPQAGAFSSLVGRLGLADKIAPPRPSAEVLGPVLPEIAARTGLRQGTPVHCGIHDSNASLLPHLKRRTPPFSVVSTGTWVIVMGLGLSLRTLDPARDTLINVSAEGAPVPSARFMGGREFEQLIPGTPPAVTEADMLRVMRDGTMLLPTLAPGTGPFPDRASRWIGPRPPRGSGAEMAAVSLYLALMTATCLRLIGHRGDIVVEGPFSRNDIFCRMLSAAMAAPLLRSGNATGTSHGAALLADAQAATGAGEPSPLSEESVELRSYAAEWAAAVEA